MDFQLTDSWSIQANAGSVGSPLARDETKIAEDIEWQIPRPGRDLYATSPPQGEIPYEGSDWPSQIRRYVDRPPNTAERVDLNVGAFLTASAPSSHSNLESYQHSLLRSIYEQNCPWNGWDLLGGSVSQEILTRDAIQRVDDWLRNTRDRASPEINTSILQEAHSRANHGNAFGDNVIREVGSLFPPQDQPRTFYSISLDTDDIDQDDFTEPSSYEYDFSSRQHESVNILRSLSPRRGFSPTQASSTEILSLTAENTPVSMGYLDAKPKERARPTVSKSPSTKFAEDPTSYFDHLLSLSQRILGHSSELLNNLETDSEQNILSFPDLNYKKYLEDSSEPVLNLDDSLRSIAAVLRGLKMLQDEGFTKSSFNIIVVDNERPSVLKVVSISIPTLNMLAKLLHEIAATTATKIMNEILRDILEVLQHIISSLGFNITVTQGNLPSWHDWRAIYQLQSSILTTLHLALLSFIRSHIDVNGSIPTGVLSEGLQIRTVGGSIVMAPRCLRCMSGFLKQPVWAFHFEPTTSTSSTFDFDGFYLSVSLEEFAQLWGPLRFDVPTSQNPNALFIEVRGGIIFRVEPTASSDSITIHDNEVLCHWLGWLDKEPPPQKEALEIPITKHLLIGAPGLQHERRRRGRPMELIIEDTCACLKGHRYSSQLPDFELRTTLPSWYIDAKTFQLSGGKYITVSMGCTYKFDAGWTLKDSIIDDWLDSEAAKSNPLYQPYQSYLDYLSVVEISRCTGNARRISLWTLLKNASLVAWFKTRFDWTHFQKVSETINHLHEIQHISHVWQTLSSEQRETLTSVFKCILSELRFTGVGEDNLLQVWDISFPQRRDGRKINPQWTSMVKDSVGCVTFAIMTPSCMTYNECVEKIIKTMICVDAKDLVEERPGRSTSGIDRYPQFSSVWSVAPSERSTVEETPQQVPEDQNNPERLLIERLTQRQRAREAHNAKSMGLPNGGVRANPYGSAATASAMQFNSRERSIPQSSRLSQPIPRYPKHAKLFVGNYFQFLDIAGQKLGRLILEDHDGPNASFDVRKFSPSMTILTQWEQHRGLALLDKIDEKEEALDRKIETWTQRANGFLPRMVGRMFTNDDKVDIWTATEFIRGPMLKDHEKVFRSFVR